MYLHRRVAVCLVALAMSLTLPKGLLAVDYQSNSFILRDPVISIEGGRSTSASFEAFTSAGQTDIGQSTSAAFTHRAGFLYFPSVSSPALTATRGNAEVSLSWTAASASLGFSVSGYEVGQATSSGGPYAYTSVGNIFSSTRTSLTNGTTYYFVVRALDAYSSSIATSTEEVAMPAVPGSGGGTGSGSSGGGAAAAPAAPSAALGQIALRGYAYPTSPVTVLGDGQVVATTGAAGDGSFTLFVRDLTPGIHLFTVMATDPQGRQSGTLNAAAMALAGETTAVSGILLPPTLGADKREVRRGEPVVVEGYATPEAEVSLVGEGTAGRFLVIVPADSSGRFRYQLDSSQLQTGAVTLTARTAVHGITSAPSIGVQLGVGARTVAAQPFVLCQVLADFNHDCRVDLIDFSILLYWFDTPKSPAHLDLSGDGAVTLVDFSIMMYHWNG